MLLLTGQKKEKKCISIDIYAIWAKVINQFCNFASQIIVLDEQLNHYDRQSFQIV